MDSGLLAGDAEVGAGKSAFDEIHCATPRAAVEAGNIRKDRCRVKRSIGHARRQDFAGRKLDLNVTDVLRVWYSDSDSEAKPGDATEEGEHSDGMCIHIHLQNRIPQTIPS